MFEELVVSAELQPDGQLWVVRRYPSNMAYCTGGRVPDRVVREVYCGADGRVFLNHTIEGKHIPARSVPESFEFGEEA